MEQIQSSGVMRNNRVVALDQVCRISSACFEAVTNLLKAFVIQRQTDNSK